MASDADFDKVLFVANFEHAGAPYAVRDYSRYGRAVRTADSALNYVTATAKYGTYGWYNAEGSGLYLPTSSEYTFTADFCIEAWFRLTGMTSYRYFFGQQMSAYGYPLSARYDSSGTVYILIGNSVVATSSAGVIAADSTFYHIALARVSGVLRLFVNGVSACSYSTSATIGKTIPLMFGGAGTGWYCNTCYIDEPRITKGAGRYSSTFTPASFFTTISGVVYDENGDLAARTVVAHPKLGGQPVRTVSSAADGTWSMLVVDTEQIVVAYNATGVETEDVMVVTT